MNTSLPPLVRPRRSARRAGARGLLVTCPICLSVRRGSAWLEPERVIRELRSYELDALPPMQSAVCDACAASIFDRRAPESREQDTGR